MDSPCEPSEESVEIQLEKVFHDNEPVKLQGEKAKEAREMIGEEKGKDGKTVVNAKKAVWGPNLKVFMFWVGRNLEVQSEKQVKESYGMPVDEWWYTSKSRSLHYKGS